jgi:hypothetical protein
MYWDVVNGNIALYYLLSSVLVALVIAGLATVCRTAGASNPVGILYTCCIHTDKLSRHLGINLSLIKSRWFIGSAIMGFDLIVCSSPFN